MLVNSTVFLVNHSQTLQLDDDILPSPVNSYATIRPPTSVNVKTQYCPCRTDQDESANLHAAPFLLSQIHRGRGRGRGRRERRLKEEMEKGGSYMAGKQMAERMERGEGREGRMERGESRVGKEGEVRRQDKEGWRGEKAGNEGWRGQVGGRLERGNREGENVLAKS